MVIHRDLSREDLIARIQDVAAPLGTRTVSRSQFLRETGIRDYHIYKRFDSYTDFVERAGLEPHTLNRRLSEDELFATMRDAFLAAGGIVTRTKFRRLARVSDDTLAKRWGRWQNTLAHFRAWIVANDLDFPYLDDLPTSPPDALSQRAGSKPLGWSQARTRTRYGPFLNFRGLQHAPINEQGVVFLFGMVAFDLGYIVEGVGTGFPDCEAKRCVSKSGDVWERVRIEFEYRSRNFLEHGHPSADCDVLVCWEHNWPECPIEVLELKSAIELLSEEG